MIKKPKFWFSFSTHYNTHLKSLLKKNHLIDWRWFCREGENIYLLSWSFPNLLLTPDVQVWGFCAGITIISLSLRWEQHPVDTYMSALVSSVWGLPGANYINFIEIVSCGQTDGRLEPEIINTCSRSSSTSYFAISVTTVKTVNGKWCLRNVILQSTCHVTPYHSTVLVENRVSSQSTELRLYAHRSLSLRAICWWSVVWLKILYLAWLSRSRLDDRHTLTEPASHHPLLYYTPKPGYMDTLLPLPHAIN